MTTRILSLLLLILLYSSCKEDQATKINKFDDPILVKINDLKDRRLSDSLYQYFNSAQPTYRQEAVLAFASLQDSTAVSKIGRLLMMDTSTMVKQNAAIALGQTRCNESERILLGAISRKGNISIINELLEAYGKTTSHWQLIHNTFQQDTNSSSGLAWSIFRAGLTGSADTSVHAVAAELLDQQYSFTTRLSAAHYFSRSAKDFEKCFEAIRFSALKDPKPEVRMASALALRKIKSEASLDAISEILATEKDYRVKVNAIRSLNAFPYEHTRDLLLKALEDKNANVGITASEVIKSAPGEKDWIQLSNLAGNLKNWRIQSNIYETALAASENTSLAKEIQTLYKRSSNPYQKAALLSALSASQDAYPFIETELFSANPPVITSAAAGALVAVNLHRNFDKKLQKTFAGIYQKAITEGDAAVVGIICGALADTTLNYRRAFKDYNFLYEAKRKLSLPKNYEALQPLNAAIAYFEGSKKPVPTKNNYNHPIDWVLVKKISTTQVAVIKTTRGNIVIKLLVEDAPGSVANFVSLAQADYFDNKFFHRVVPNFVVQAGCNRGDGWGSEEYSIRSEFGARHFKTGSVGMASAGKDTEGTQWFITHSPAPHLDGRYAIFAEVIEGLEVVDYLEVGDKILDVEVKLNHQ